MFLLQRLGLISGQERRFHKWFVLALVSEVAQLCPTTWTVAYQAPLSIGFSRQEYWSGLPFPSPGNLPDPGVEPTSPVSPALQADPLPPRHQGRPGRSSPASFPDGSEGKESTCHAGDSAQGGLSPGSGRSPEKEMATHSSILAWKLL